MTKIQLCLKVLQDNTKNTASGIAHLWHCLREDYPDFRDATDAAESFFDGHANKVFVAACVVSLFTSFWPWVAGAALGLF
ncbi:MAG: hypothetical protein KDK78_07615, partial [Chlamydiia bacterium]|nr:hypothetical protein [Chlamydiia bacterium]